MARPQQGEGDDDMTSALDELNDMIRKQLTLRGVWHMNMHDAPDLLTFLRRAPEKADLLITHRLPLAEIHQGMALLEKGEAAKVILYP